jgi:hypothetical protein
MRQLVQNSFFQLAQPWPNENQKEQPMQVSKTMMALAGVAAMALATGATAPAFAHHSFAMFDNQKNTTLEGTVKEFQWTNPHSWVQLMVKDPATGKDVEWSIEGGSPNGLARNGWKRTSLKPGDKAVVVIHPLKDGANGGSLVTVTVDGVQIGAPRG